MRAAEQKLSAEQECDEPSAWSAALIEEPSGRPFFPQVELGWAIQYLADLHKRAKRQPVSLDELAAAWDVDPEGSEMVETIDALLAYGFLEHSGQGSERRFRISELGRRVREHPDREVIREALAEAALKPAIIPGYIERWNGWRDARPADDVYITELESEHGLTQKEAKQFLRVYSAACLFTGQVDPFVLPEPLPRFAKRRRVRDPAQNPWTKWRPEIDAFCNATAE